MTEPHPIAAVVLISAGTEWRALLPLFPTASPHASPYGDWFITEMVSGDQPEPIAFLHTGWGKIRAAAGAQYAIDRWSPTLLVNLGTCGGFAGHVEPGEVILANRTVVYDIVERMGDPDAAIATYSTELDLSWLGDAFPIPVRPGTLVSADADLDPLAITDLHTRYGAVAGDWESGATAYVAARNNTRCLILRGVTDLVGPSAGDAYDGTLTLFTEATRPSSAA